MTQFLVFSFVIWSISAPWKMSQLFLKPKGLKMQDKIFKLNTNCMLPMSMVDTVTHQPNARPFLTVIWDPGVGINYLNKYKDKLPHNNL